jgi:2-polyprenyl-6-methoxyphenol hydroxylase-like FAD-dependent oxidoreductase
MTARLSIAVIGAGMGGLAAAAALCRAGVDVTVYEQARRFARLGAGIQVGCNAMQVHPMTPYMAQGAAMALEDAAVLSRLVAEVDSRAALAGVRRTPGRRRR